MEGLDNDKSNLSVYDLAGNKVQNTSNIGTGYILRLEKSQEILDELTIIKKGDLNGDGLITAPDFALLRKYINREETLSFIEKVAADLNDDGYLTLSDLIKFEDYIGGTINSLNQ